MDSFIIQALAMEANKRKNEMEEPKENTIRKKAKPEKKAKKANLNIHSTDNNITSVDESENEYYLNFNPWT